VKINIYHILFILLCCLPKSWAIAQESIGGMVLDAESKQRIGKVFIVNKTTGENTYNNSKGEFSLTLKPGDIIIANKENYHGDTVSYAGAKALVISLKRKTIAIAPVTVMGRVSPEEILARRREEYNKAYRLADPGDFVSVGQNGAGLSIDAVYNYFSREGKNARRLTKYFQKEYEDNYIDIVFTRELVRGVTGLEGEPLDNFMIRYRPEYNFVLTADRYQLVKYIKTKYEYFKHIPYIKPLPDLKEIDLNLEN
jgi:co-chaperonin GroES (HSP10)